MLFKKSMRASDVDVGVKCSTNGGHDAHNGVSGDAHGGEGSVDGGVVLARKRSCPVSEQHLFSPGMQVSCHFESGNFMLPVISFFMVCGSKWVFRMLCSRLPKLVSIPHFSKIVVEVKFFGPPHVLKLW